MHIFAKPTEIVFWIWMLICKAPTGQYADGFVTAYGHGATSWLLNSSKEPASATTAGSSFQSLTVR